MPSSELPSASIVVPTYERRDALLRLLRALAAQTVPADRFEVIVAIDGSDDGTREAVAVFEPPFQLRSIYKERRGRAAACNAGASLAVARLLIFLDDDMEPSPGFVEAHLDAHREGRPLGVVGAAPIYPDADASLVTRFRAEGFARKLQRLATLPDGLAFTDVYTGNFSLPRSVFVAAGGYDEAFRRYGHEDYEFVHRLTRAGVRFVFDAAALARQHYTKDLRALAANVRDEGSTAVLFALKHPEAAPALGLTAYAGRSRRTRIRLTALLALSRVWRTVPDHLIRHAERLERRGGPGSRAVIFAHYRLIFDLVHWLGVEDALHERGAPRRMRFDAVVGWIAAMARTPGPFTESAR